LSTPILSVGSPGEKAAAADETAADKAAADKAAEADKAVMDDDAENDTAAMDKAAKASAAAVSFEAVVSPLTSRQPITSDVERIRVLTVLWSLPEIAKTCPGSII
jgi:hypothetical protein